MLLSRKMRIPRGTNWIMYIVPTTKVEMASIQAITGNIQLF